MADLVLITDEMAAAMVEKMTPAQRKKAHIQEPATKK